MNKTLDSTIELKYKHRHESIPEQKEKRSTHQPSVNHAWCFIFQENKDKMQDNLV